MNTICQVLWYSTVLCSAWVLHPPSIILLYAPPGRDNHRRYHSQECTTLVSPSLVLMEGVKSLLNNADPLAQLSCIYWQTSRVYACALSSTLSYLLPPFRGRSTYPGRYLLSTLPPRLTLLPTRCCSHPSSALNHAAHLHLICQIKYGSSVCPSCEI